MSRVFIIWRRVFLLLPLIGIVCWRGALPGQAAPATLQVTPVHRETPAAWHPITSLTQAYPPVDVVGDGSDQTPILTRTPQGGVVLGVPAFTGRARDVVLQLSCGTPVAAAPTRLKLHYRFLHPERLPNLIAGMLVPTMQVGQMTYGENAFQPGKVNHIKAWPAWIPGGKPGWQFGSEMTGDQFDLTKPQSVDALFDAKHFGGMTINGFPCRFTITDWKQPPFTELDFPTPMPYGGKGVNLTWNFNGVPAGVAESLIQIDEFTVEQLAPQRAVAEVTITLPEARRVSLVVEDSRRVGINNLLVDRPLPQGVTRFVWDGRDAWGGEVFDGGYTFRMVTHNAHWAFAGVAGNTTPWDDMFHAGAGCGNFYAGEAPMSVAVFPTGAKAGEADVSGRVMIGLSDFEQEANLLLNPDGAVLHNKIHNAASQWSGGMAAGQTFNAVSSIWEGVQIWDNTCGRQIPMPAWGADGRLHPKRPVENLLLPYATTAASPTGIAPQPYRKDFAIFGNPFRGLAVIPGDEVLLVTNAADGEIAWYSIKEGGKRLGGLALDDPRAVAVAPPTADGRRTVYAATKAGVVTFPLNPDWSAGAIRVLAPAGKFAYACRLAYDPRGRRLFVTDLYDSTHQAVHNQVWVFSEDGNTIACFGQPGGVKDPLLGGPIGDDIIAGPTGIAVDPAGDVWVCDSVSHRVLKYAVDAQGRFTRNMQVASPANCGSFWIPGEPETAMWSQTANGEMVRCRLERGKDNLYHMKEMDGFSQVVGAQPVRQSGNSWATQAMFQRVKGRTYLVTARGALNVYLVEGTTIRPVASIGPELTEQALPYMPRPAGDPHTWMGKPWIWTDTNLNGQVDPGELVVVTDTISGWTVRPSVWMDPDGSLVASFESTQHGVQKSILKFTPTFLPNGVPRYDWAKKQAVFTFWPNGQQPPMRWVPLGIDSWAGVCRWAQTFEAWGMNDLSLYDAKGARLWSRCREIGNTQSVEPLGGKFLVACHSTIYQLGLYDREGNLLLNIGRPNGFGYMYSREHIWGDNWFAQVREISPDEALVTASEQTAWRSMLWRVTGLTTVQAVPPVTCLLRGYADAWVQDEGDRAWVDVDGYWFSGKADPNKDPGHRTAMGASGEYLFALDPAKITWHLGVRPPGKYRISILLPYAAGGGGADEQATYTIQHAGKSDTVTIDQNIGSFQMAGAVEEDPESQVVTPGTPKTVWIPLGVFTLDGQGKESVTLAKIHQHMVHADGLKLERAD